MDCYELTIITIKDLIGKADGIDGYTLMKYLSGKFESIESQLFSVDAEQVIIHAPEQYGVGMGFSISQLYDEAVKIVDVEINSVTINIDYDRKQLLSVYARHYNATRKDKQK